MRGRSIGICCLLICGLLAWQMSEGPLVFAQVGRQVPAEVVASWNATSLVGKVDSIGPQGATVTTFNGEKIAVHVWPHVAKNINVKGTAGASMIKPGLGVRFSGKMDESGVVATKVTSLRLIQVDPVLPEILLDENALITGKIGSKDSKGNVKLVINGVKKEVQGEKEVIKKRQKTASVTLADDVKVFADLRDLSLARKGDIISVTGRVLKINDADQAGQVVAESIVVDLSEFEGAASAAKKALSKSQVAKATKMPTTKGETAKPEKPEEKMPGKEPATAEKKPGKINDDAKEMPIWAKKDHEPNETDAFFAKGTIPELRFEVPPAEYEKLRQNTRETRIYALGTMKENGKTIYKNVGIKLKGAAGSFRAVDDKPALTLNMDKFEKGQSFHEMDKFHLNNSVQDPTYLNEMISADLYYSSGMPAPRVTHARVWLNNRDLGLYVLKEGVHKKLLARLFADPTGNLYDAGFCRDLDVDFEKDFGKGVDDLSDLRALRAAVQEQDPAKRVAAIEQIVDVDAFLTFMALEMMSCHWDGYACNRNNFRIYFEPITKKAFFLPQGMDQMFGDPAFPVTGVKTMLSTAILQNPEWQTRYQERLVELTPLFSPTRIISRVDFVHNRMQPALTSMGPDFALDHANQVRELKMRIIHRMRGLEQQTAIR